MAQAKLVAKMALNAYDSILAHRIKVLQKPEEQTQYVMLCFRTRHLDIGFGY